MPTTEPTAGEVYWLNSTPGRGREQQGRRPALVVTDSRLASLGLTWIVPLTSTDRGWPLHVRVHCAGKVSVAMCEQLRSVSIERLGHLIDVVAPSDMAEVRAVLHAIIGH